jgi:hypothetical protein
MVSLDQPRMKKEIIFAVSIGLIVGLIITFGMYRAQQAMKGASTINSSITDALTSPQTSSANQQSEDAFLVTQPEDESLVTEASIHVSGQTYPNSTIVVLGGTTEAIGSSDDKGNFSVAVNLQSGANILSIRVLNPNYNTLEVVRSVIFSTADLTINSVATASAKTTPSPTPATKKLASPTPAKTQ